MKKALIVSAILILALFSVACSQTATGEIVKSNLDRQTNPSPDEADVSTLVTGNNTFAFDLYRILKAEQANVFYSPYSISLALAMTYAGARNETEQQMSDTLWFLLDQENLHPAFNYLDIELGKRGQGAKGKDDEGFRLNIVNAIWGQEDYEFLADYLDLLAQNYGAGLRLLNFAEKPEPSRLTINKWVSDQTEGRIEDLIPQGLINAMTRLVLTNAIYFNAAWLYPFETELTQNGQFHLLDGNTATVPMMRQSEKFGYMEGEDYQAVELHYDGNELSMIIILPDPGKFGAFEDRLDIGRMNEIIQELDYQQVRLTMPSFEFSSSFSLREALSAMGMPIAFSGDADFSGMTGARDLFIRDVVHKTFISVDEAGTEAAAATAVIMELTAAPEKPVEVNIDHPFIFLIRDIETGSILFVGKVINPAV